MTETATTAFSWAFLTPVLPEIFLAVAGMILLIAGVVRGNEGTAVICRATMLAFLISGLTLLGISWDGTTSLNGFFVLDSFTAFSKILVLTGLIAAMALSTRYLRQENMNLIEYPVLVLFAGLGMMLMISAGNLLAMYVGLELQSLSLYVLAAIRRDHAKSSEAGLKYFVLGALASGMMLFGISLIYGYTGAIGFDQIAQTVTDGGRAGPGLVVGMVFLLAGLAFKISAAPFHMWTPDVYEGAPTSVTALFALVPKTAMMALLLRILHGAFGGAEPEWQQIVWFLSAASMLVGAFAAIPQTNIKRLMAYSSIGNMGYALVGVTAGTAAGAGAVMLYMTIYMIMTAGVFGIILSMRRQGTAVETISDLAGFSRNHPLAAWTMAFLMFSMAGIPPLAGFFGKLFIFQSAISAGFPVLAVLGVLSSVVAAYYYIRIIKIMFFDEAADPFDRDVSPGLRIVTGLSIAVVVGMIAMPEVLVNMTRAVASALFAG